MACAGPCNDPSRHQIATHGGSRRDAQLHPIQLLGEDLQNQRELLEGAGTLACLPTLRGRWRGLILGRTNIGSRPSMVDAKSCCMDLEKDLIVGTGHCCLVPTVVYHRSKHTLLGALGASRRRRPSCRSQSRSACSRSEPTTEMSSTVTRRWPQC